MSPNQPFVFELCAETLEACLQAGPGGAHRIELCTRLDVGGLTPSAELVEQAIKRSSVPVHVLLRPQEYTFAYSPEMFELIADSIRKVRGLGAAGVVLGFLNWDGTVDVEHTGKLVELAGPLEVTFHRAFDETPDTSAALEAVIATGCQRLLTSGGAQDVLAGAEVLARLTEQAAGRIDIAAGGGLRLENATAVARAARTGNYHASLRNGHSGLSLAERIRAMMQALADGAGSPN